MLSRFVGQALLCFALCMSAFSQPSNSIVTLPSTSVIALGAKGNGINDDAPSIQRAIDATPRGSSVYFPTGTYRLGSALVLNRPNVTLRLDASAVLLKNSNADILRISADGVTIHGGILDGQGEKEFTGGGITAHDCKGLTITNSTVKNAQGSGIYLANVSNFLIASNIITGNRKTGIFGEFNTANGVIEANVIDNSNATPASHDIAFHSSLAQHQVMELTILNNRLGNGRVFCIEVGAFGGLRPTRITVGPGNTCEATEESFGGVSFDSVDASKIIQNSYDSRGQATHMAIELVQSSDILVSGNKINGRNKMKSGIAVTGSHDSHLTGNTISGFYYSGIKGYAAQDRPLASDNVIETNTLDFESSTQATGIWFEDDARTAKMDRNIIRQNIFRGGNSVKATGVRLDCNSCGSLDGTAILQNTLENLDLGFDTKHSVNTRAELNTFTAVKTPTASENNKR